MLQDVFAQAFRQAARYDASRGAVAAWLLMMARSQSDRSGSRAADAARGADVGDVQLLDEMPDSQPDAASAMLDEEQTRISPAGARRPAAAAADGNRASRITKDSVTPRSRERLEQPLGTVKTRIRLGC